MILHIPIFIYSEVTHSVATQVLLILFGTGFPLLIATALHYPGGLAMPGVKNMVVVQGFGIGGSAMLAAVLFGPVLATKATKATVGPLSTIMLLLCYAGTVLALGIMQA